MGSGHRHLSNMDCLMAHTALFASLVLLTAAAEIKEKKPIKTITNHKQSILETFDMYGLCIL